MNLFITSGGIQHDFAENASGVYYYEGDTLVSHAMTISGITNSGTIIVESGGLVQDIVPDRPATSSTLIEVNSGGKAEDLELCRKMTINNGGTADNINAKGMLSTMGSWTPELTVNAGGSLTNLEAYAANITVKQGASVGGALLNAFSVMNLYGDGVNITVNGYYGPSPSMNSYVNIWRGTLNLYGKASNTTIARYGSVNIHSGAVASGITTQGELQINSGASATDITIAGGKTCCAGNAKNIIISGGIAEIKDGAVVENVQVHIGNALYISSGTFVTDIKENGGAVQVESGAVVSFAQYTAENLTLTGSATIHAGTVFKNATANNASVHIYSGGIAESILTNKGTLRIESGGSASIAFNPWEKAAITSDAGAVITYFDPTSQMYLGNFQSGLIGTANSYTEVTRSNYIHTYNGCHASGFKVNGGTYIMSQGASAEETSINASGRVSVCYGAQAQNTIVNAGGNMIVSNGGKADTTTVYSRGNISVLAGASASNIIVLNGGGIELAIEKGTFAQGESAGSAFDMRDGYLSGYRVNAATTVGNGGVLYDTTLCNGNWDQYNTGLMISSGGLASKTAGSGVVNVFSGGSAIDTVLSGGGVNVYDGGVAENISLSNSARITVYGGASATGINANNGRAFIYQGASVSGMTFSRGDINIFSGAFAEDINITSAHLRFSSGGTASDTTINAGGHLFASSGAFADDTTINCWGNASVFAGGVMQDTTIKTGGKLTLVSGGLHKGELNIESGGSALAYAGTTIDFTVAGRTVQDGYLINDLSAIKYNPTYTITVSSDLEQGIYKLAQYAGSLRGTITIKTENGSIGKISVNGESFEYNGVEYTLNNINSNLTLTVYKGEDITPCRTDIYGTGVSQILAWDKNKGTVGAIYNDGVNQVHWRGIWDWGDTETELWRVAGAGFFDGSDVLHDGVLLYNGKGDRFASWTNLSIGSYGYTDLWKVAGSFNTKTLADLDGNQHDDILIYDGNGSIGVVLDGTHYRDIWHVEEGGSSIWQLEGAGSFGEGMDKLVMLNKSNNHVYLWTNNDTSFETWNWSAKDAGKLASGWEIAAIGDFEGDGTDDIMVLERSTNNVWVWDDGNSQTKRWRGTLGEGFEIEAVGDYNGDGKEDLLLREHNSGWGGLGYWGAGYAGNWVDFNARIETDTRISGSVFEIIA